MDSNSEKEMIGSILDDSGEDEDNKIQKARKDSQKLIDNKFHHNLTLNLGCKKKNSLDSAKASDLVSGLTDQLDKFNIQATRIYSPQLRPNNNNYNYELKLNQVPSMQSAPGSALKQPNFEHNGYAFQYQQPQQNHQTNLPQFNEHSNKFPYQNIQVSNQLNLQESDPTHSIYYFSQQQQFNMHYQPQMMMSSFGQQDTFDESSFLEGDLIIKCKDQHNARRIQKIFKQADLDKRQTIYQKLEKGSLILSKDVFGNYVIQNLIDFGTKQQRLKLLNNIFPSIVLLSFHNYGCRVIQKALEIFHQESMKEFNQIFDQLKSQIRQLVVDANGNHVVQKIVQLQDKEVAEWVQDGVRGQVLRLTQNSFGCRIIQKMITISQHQQIQVILDEIMVIAQELCFSQFGNYIIQQLLQDAPELYKDTIHNIIIENFEELSLDKFGSNVIDQAIKMSDNQFKLRIINLLLKPSSEGYEVLFVKLSNNAFGNYVVQNFFKQVDYQLQDELYIKIAGDPQLIQDIQLSQFGQYVFQSLLKRQDMMKFELQ